MLPFKAGEVMQQVAALQNDIEQQVYNDSVILPYMKIAYDDLRREMENYNIPITNVTSEPLLISQGMKDIGGPTGPALPNDLVEILSISERTNGTQNDYLMMARRQFLPETEVLTAYLQVWSYQNQMIKFIGANGDIQVKLNYIASNLGELINADSTIRMFNAKTYLAYRTAGHCSFYIGENESRAQVLYGEATNALDILINLSVKNQQGIRTRRQPFRARYKANGSYPQ